MRLPRRQFLRLAAGAVALPAVSQFATAQTYPTRQVRMIAPFPPGGVVDLFGRLLAQWLSERFGQPFVVENRAGAGGNIGTEAVVKAAPDGYTLLLIGANNSWNASLYEKLNFDFIRDIAPVAGIFHGIGALVVHPSFSAQSVPELIAYAKSNPGKINVGTGGIGSGQHVYAELFKMMTGVDMLYVHYRGGAPALTDLLAGQVQIMFDSVPTSGQHISSGKLRPLAVLISP
jgi:tripartite-type tricarboxylate transporter receptor subunit TctC